MVGCNSGTALGDVLMQGVRVESHNTSEIAKGGRQVEKNTRSKL